MKDKIIIKGDKHTVDRFLHALHLSLSNPLIFETTSYNTSCKGGFTGFYRGIEIYVEYDETDINNDAVAGIDNHIKAITDYSR